MFLKPRREEMSNWPVKLGTTKLVAIKLTLNPWSFLMSYVDLTGISMIVLFYSLLNVGSPKTKLLFWFGLIS